MLVTKNVTVCTEHRDKGGMMTVLSLSEENMLELQQPTEAFCASEEIVANFVSLLRDVDFSQELRFCRVGFFNRTLRRTFLEECKSVYIGLWALALEQSFPRRAEDLFAFFVEKHMGNLHRDAQKQWEEKVWDYRHMILHSNTNDFSHISRHLLSFVVTDEKNMKADILRLSLLLRNHYTFIFQRLV